MGLTWTQRARTDAGTSGFSGVTVFVADSESSFPSTYQATAAVSCNVEVMNSLLAVKGVSGPPVQTPNASSSTATGQTTFSQAFGVNNTAGDTIIVIFAGQPNAFGPVTVGCTDTQGNSYSHTLHNLLLGGLQQMDIFVATGIAAGANTVTITASGGGGGFSSNFANPGIAILEYPPSLGVDAVALQTSAMGGNVTVSITTGATNDLMINAVIMGPRCDPPSPVISSPPTPIFQRGNIDFDQVRASVRSGPAGTFAMLASAHPVPGNVATFDASGDLQDSGAPPAGGTVTNSGTLTADQPVFGAGTTVVKVGTKTGNTDEVVSATGAATSGYPLVYDASGNAEAKQPRGNTTVAQLADSTTNPTTGDLAEFDANGNIKDAGILASTVATNPMTTKGDVIVGGTGGSEQRLGVGSNGQVLTANSAATDGVDWEAPLTLTTTGTSGAATYTAGNPGTLNIPNYATGGAWTKIAQSILAAPAASVTFSSIPGTYSVLVVILVCRSAAATAADNIYMEANGDTTLANYSETYIQGIAAGVSSASTATPIVGVAGGANSIANQPSMSHIVIPAYTSTAFNKTAMCTFNFWNATNQAALINNWEWNNLGVLNALKFLLASGGNFVTGSQFTLYGIS